MSRQLGRAIVIGMGRAPLLPPELLEGPFTLIDARAAGLERWHLEGASWLRIGPSTYVWKSLREDPIARLQATLCRLPAGARFSGHTAAWLHTGCVGLSEPIEIDVPPDAGVSARAGMAVRRRVEREGDTVFVRGLPATSIPLTIADLARRLSLTEAVVMADAVLHKRKVQLELLRAWADANRRRPGIRKLRRVIEVAEPASESPMESRLRMVLILGELPRPKAQVSIHDRAGRFVRRLDLYYPDQRLGIEYDGATHRDSIAEDNRRQNALLQAGVRLLRFTAADVLRDGMSVVSQVRAMIATAGFDGIDRGGFPAYAGRSGISSRRQAASG